MSITRLARHLRAARSAVYRALLDPDMVRQWMVPESMTSQVHSFDARDGGEFRISLTYDGSAGVGAEVSGRGKTSARTDTFRGRFVSLVPDRLVVQVVEFETDDQALQGAMTISYMLADAEDGGTELVGVHENLPPGVRPEDNELGWSMSLAKLAALVEADESA